VCRYYKKYFEIIFGSIMEIFGKTSQSAMLKTVLEDMGSMLKAL